MALTPRRSDCEPRAQPSLATPTPYPSSEQGWGAIAPLSAEQPIRRAHASPKPRPQRFAPILSLPDPYHLLH